MNFNPLKVLKILSIDSQILEIHASTVAPFPLPQKSSILILKSSQYKEMRECEDASHLS